MPKSLGKTAVSGAEVASITGISKAQVSQMATAGKLPRRPDGKFELGAAVAAIVRHFRQVRKPESSYEQSRSRRMAALARVAELDVGERERSLLPTEFVREVLSPVIFNLRDSILHAPIPSLPTEARRMLCMRLAEDASRAIQQLGISYYERKHSNDEPEHDPLRGAMPAHSPFEATGAGRNVAASDNVDAAAAQAGESPENETLG